MLPHHWDVGSGSPDSSAAPHHGDGCWDPYWWFMSPDSHHGKVHLAGGAEITGLRPHWQRVRFLPGWLPGIWDVEREEQER